MTGPPGGGPAAARAPDAPAQRILVRAASDPVIGLATGLQVAMDVYLRLPRDLIVVARDPEEVMERMGALVGGDVAGLLRSGAQPFAGHEMRVVASELLGQAPLDVLLLLPDADGPLLEEVEAQGEPAALIVVPRAGESLEDWVAAHTPIEVAPADAETGTTGASK